MNPLLRFGLECAAAIVAVIIVTHLFAHAREFMSKKPFREALIPVLEFFVVVVMGGVAADILLRPTQEGAPASNWTNDPHWQGIVVLFMLVTFALFSMVLYILDRRASG